MVQIDLPSLPGKGTLKKAILLVLNKEGHALRQVLILRQMYQIISWKVIVTLDFVIVPLYKIYITDC